MKLLADENVHSIVIARLRAKGYEVEAIAELAPGTPDHAILSRDDIGELVLITYDRDFGDLIFNKRLPVPKILIYSRLGRAEPFHVSERIVEILQGSPKDGMFYVIAKDGVRPRPFNDGTTENG